MFDGLSTQFPRFGYLGGEGKETPGQGKSTVARFPTAIAGRSPNPTVPAVLFWSLLKQLVSACLHSHCDPKPYSRNHRTQPSKTVSTRTGTFLMPSAKNFVSYQCVATFIFTRSNPFTQLLIT